jgi:uncharacterized protein (TIGR00730 family)
MSKKKCKIPLKAYEDIEFLRSDYCRASRLQLEFLKPETVMQERKIRSTIVLFGSARIPAPQKARAMLKQAEAALAAKPGAPELEVEVLRAQHKVEQSRYYAMAQEFAALVSKCSQRDEECDFVIMTGGGPGIMEAGNRGAADVGAKSIGLNISLPYEQAPNPYISDGLCFQFHYFSIRKMHFLLRAKALCALPGGFGTMDEVFETLTLIQTHKIPPMPVVLFGSEFWRDIINWDVFVERGLVSPEDLEIFRFCDSAQEGWDYIRNFWSYNHISDTEKKNRGRGKGEA